MIAVLTFLATLSLVVLVHEYGHFWTARRFGVTVHEFGFGFPPRLFAVRRGATEYSLNLVPFGGFVRLEGEGEDTAGPGSFRSIAPHRRVAVLLAGVAMNLALAVVLFSVAFTAGVPTEVDPANVPAGVSDLHVTVAAVVAGSPAARAGLEAGDRLTALNGAGLTSMDQVRERVSAHPDEPLTLALERGSGSVPVTVVPEPGPDGAPRIGIAGATVGTFAEPFPRSIARAFQLTGTLIWEVLRALGTFVRDLFIDQRVSDQISGPIGIAVLSGKVSAVGFAAVLQFIGALSVSLAVLNALPLPMLDGGRAFLTAIERIRRRPIPAIVERRFHTVGIVALLALVVVVSVKDVQRFGILDQLRGLLP